MFKQKRKEFVMKSFITLKKSYSNLIKVDLNHLMVNLLTIQAS